MNVLNFDEAHRRKEEAVAQSDKDMSEKNRAMFRGKTIRALRRFRYYNTDLIEEWGLGKKPLTAAQKKALGPVNTALKKEGKMEYLGFDIQSRYPPNHQRKKACYRSLIFDPELENDDARGEMEAVVADIEAEHARRPD